MKRSRKENLLDFFLNARRALVREWTEELPISSLRQIADEEFKLRKHKSHCYLKDFQKSNVCLPLPEFVFDADFRHPLGRIQRGFFSPEAEEVGAVALFLPPSEGILTLDHDSAREWQSFLASMPPKALCLRTGFLSTEFDVLESIALGFGGVCIHARLLDVYEIQLLTEICRDFKMTMVAVADSAATLGRILESDCPYVGLWGYDAHSFTPDFGLISKLAPKIPGTCYRVAFLPSQPEPQWDVLKGMNIASCVW